MISSRAGILTGATVLALLAYLVASPGRISAGISPVQPGIYGGTHNGGGNVVIAVVDTGSDVRLTFLAENIPLGTPCQGQTATVFLPDVQVNVPDESFSDGVSNGGAGGQFLLPDPQSGPPIPYIVGSAFAHLPGPDFECINSVTYEADFDPLQAGDVDCSGISHFLGSPGANLSGSGDDDPEPPDPNGVTAVDALKILRFVAELPSGNKDEECPDVGTETPSEIVIGDANCDGEVTAVDALIILRFVAQLPVTPPPNPQPPACPRMGIYYDPG
jgi:hypothetical protein